MVRAKVELKLIGAQRQRKATYRKRIQGLKKKTYELAILCSVPALLISFGPSGRVDTWPDNSQEIRDIVTRYNGLSREARDKHKLNLLGFLKSQIRRQQAELDRKVRDPRLDNEPEEALRELTRVLDLKVEAVMERIKLLEDQECLETNADVNGIEEIFGEEAIINWQIWKEDGVDHNQNVGFGCPSEAMAFNRCLDACGFEEPMGFARAQVAMDPFLQYSYAAPMAFQPTPIAFRLPTLPPESAFGIFNHHNMGAGGEEQFYTTTGIGLNGMHHLANDLRNDPSSSGIGAVVNSANMHCPFGTNP